MGSPAPTPFTTHPVYGGWAVGGSQAGELLCHRPGFTSPTPSMTPPPSMTLTLCRIFDEVHGSTHCCGHVRVPPRQGPRPVPDVRVPATSGSPPSPSLPILASPIGRAQHRRCTGGRGRRGGGGGGERAVNP